jgi:hypothetical protein
MKPIVAALLAAAVALPTAAGAATIYDPAENEFIAAPAPANPANVSAAAASAERLTEQARVWDPVESTFVVYDRAPDQGLTSAVSTNDAAVPGVRIWDPVESTFTTVPAR